MDRTRAIADLLVSLFTEAELRMFLRSLPDGEVLAACLPAGPAPLSLLAFEAVALLERHGRIDAELFRHLHQERPGRRGDIERVALLQSGRGAAGPRISISRLPISGAHFVGREDALAQLDAAWDDPHVRVLSIVALGGAGKTALVNRWLHELERDGWRGAERVFGWSFYSQGTRDSVTSAEPFIDAALRWFGDPDPTAGSPRDRGLRLAELIRRQRTLLVLDGVEPLQHPPGRDGLEGRLKDTDLAVFLRELAADMLGLCVITTRMPVAELASRAHGSAPQMDLGRLSAVSGAVLLRQLGVTGPDAELHEAAEDMHGHALALTLLGRYLERARGGDVRCREDLPVLEAAERIGSDKAYRVMAAYDAWLGERERAVLRLLGLFDRPADEGAMTALRAVPPIPDLTDGLTGLPEDLWRITLSNLRAAGLLAPAVLHAPGTLDAHPLVRAYFGELLRARQPEAWRAAHLRLYEHYRRVAPLFAVSLDELAPLVVAMVHGCHAGRRQEALDEIYWKRMRHGFAHSVHHLGAYGADLTALSGLFERPWDQPALDLDGGDQAFVLNEAGYDLRALGRLNEARAPMQASLDRQKERQDWRDAAIAASNLSDLLLALGHVDRAVAQAAESVALADRSGGTFARLACRTALADALHQAGDIEESRAVFEEVESMQRRTRKEPHVISLDWSSYCDLLLGCATALESIVVTRTLSSSECQQFSRTCEEVLDRGAALLEPSSHFPWLLALGHLALGRAHLGLSVVAQVAPPGAGGGVQAHAGQAVIHLNQAVIHLRRSGREDYVPRGLLARAKLGRWLGDRDRAVQDLTEALDIAERGSMRLHECDAHLEWARYHVSTEDMDAARAHVATAKALIASTGYARRKAELAALSLALSSGNTAARRVFTRVANDDQDMAERATEMAYNPAPVELATTMKERSYHLHELEGVWVEEQNGTIFCASVVNGKLAVPYSYRACGWLTAEMYDCVLVNDHVLARFRWFHGEIAGIMRLHIESNQRMHGQWWYDSSPESYPYPVPITLIRQPDDPFPEWAEEFFARLAKGSGTPPARTE
jgi:tetratricopeptide (TPR) repeat protein